MKLIFGQHVLCEMCYNMISGSKGHNEANVSNFALQQDVIAKTTTTKLSIMNPKTKNSLLITTSLVFIIIASMIIMIIRKKRLERKAESDYYDAV